jgi:hypothetical protein
LHGGVAVEITDTIMVFQTDRLFIRISAAEVRHQLIATKGYSDAELPTQQTIYKKLSMLGFRLTKVARCRPQKRQADRCHV